MTLLASWRALDTGERKARLRCLQGLCRVFAGPAGKELTDALRRAETDIVALADCDRQLDSLPTITRRRVLCTFLQTLPVGAQ